MVEFIEREKFEGELTGQNQSIEGVDELDGIEIMRESIEARCENSDMSEFERVKLIVEMIEDTLIFEDKL